MVGIILNPDYTRDSVKVGLSSGIICTLPKSSFKTIITGQRFKIMDGLQIKLINNSKKGDDLS